MNQNWMDDPQLAQIEKRKLLLLRQFAEQGNGKTMSEMLPFLLNVMQEGSRSNLHFSEEEIQIILSVLKKGKSSAELARMEKIISILRNIRP